MLFFGVSVPFFSHGSDFRSKIGQHGFLKRVRFVLTSLFGDIWLRHEQCVFEVTHVAADSFFESYALVCREDGPSSSSFASSSSQCDGQTIAENR